MGMGKQVGDTLAGGFRNDVFGTTDMAESAQRAAAEQQRLAGSQQQQAVDYAKKYAADVSSLADLTPAQMAQHGQALQAASKNLMQRQKLLDSVDPALMEASKQVLNLLQGGDSASTPVRASQRAQLINQLRAQYGPGAENTSLGQRMLQQFDMGTLDRRSQDLGTLMGVGQYGQQLAAGVDQGIGSLGAAQSQLMGAQTQGANTVLGAMMGTNQNVLNAAGASEVGNQIKYGAQKGFWDNWSQSSMKFGENMGGMGMGMAGGGGGDDEEGTTKKKKKSTGFGGGSYFDAGATA